MKKMLLAGLTLLFMNAYILCMEEEDLLGNSNSTHLPIKEGLSDNPECEYIIDDSGERLKVPGSVVVFVNEIVSTIKECQGKHLSFRQKFNIASFHVQSIKKTSDGKKLWNNFHKTIKVGLNDPVNNYLSGILNGLSPEQVPNAFSYSLTIDFFCHRESLAELKEYDTYLQWKNLEKNKFDTYKDWFTDEKTASTETLVRKTLLVKTVEDIRQLDEPCHGDICKYITKYLNNNELNTAEMMGLSYLAYLGSNKTDPDQKPQMTFSQWCSNYSQHYEDLTPYHTKEIGPNEAARLAGELAAQDSNTVKSAKNLVSVSHSCSEVYDLLKSFQKYKNTLTKRGYFLVACQATFAEWYERYSDLSQLAKNELFQFDECPVEMHTDIVSNLVSFEAMVGTQSAYDFIATAKEYAAHKNKDITLENFLTRAGNVVLERYCDHAIVSHNNRKAALPLTKWFACHRTTIEHPAINSLEGSELVITYLLKLSDTVPNEYKKLIQYVENQIESTTEKPHEKELIEQELSLTLMGYMEYSTTCAKMKYKSTFENFLTKQFNMKNRWQSDLFEEQKKRVTRNKPMLETAHRAAMWAVKCESIDPENRIDLNKMVHPLVVNRLRTAEKTDSDDTELDGINSHNNQLEKEFNSAAQEVNSNLKNFSSYLELALIKNKLVSIEERIPTFDAWIKRIAEINEELKTKFPEREDCRNLAVQCVTRELFCKNKDLQWLTKKLETNIDQQELKNEVKDSIKKLEDYYTITSSGVWWHNFKTNFQAGFKAHLKDGLEEYEVQKVTQTSQLMFERLGTTDVHKKLNSQAQNKLFCTLMKTTTSRDSKNFIADLYSRRNL